VRKSNPGFKKIQNEFQGCQIVRNSIPGLP